MVRTALLILTSMLVGCARPVMPSAAEAPAIGARGANLIENGDFEESDAGTMYARHDPQEPPRGWMVKRGTVDVIGGWWEPASGKQSLDLNGLEPGTISQEVATQPGKTYVLSFWMAGNPDDVPRYTAVEIAWDRKVVRTVVFARKLEHRHKSMGWEHHDTLVVAKGKRTRIDFTSLSDGGWGPAIDDVRLVEAPKDVVAKAEK